MRAVCEGGIYQLLVTAFVPDNYQYIKGVLDNKKNKILPIEKRKAYRKEVLAAKCLHY